MKKHIIFTIILTGLFSMFACTELDRDPVAGLSESPVMTAPNDGTAFILTDETAGDVLATFAWSAADYGFPAAVMYDLQLDVAGNDFAKPASLGQTSDTELSITVEDLNSAVLNVLSLGPDVAHNLEARVVGTLHDSLQAAVSDVISLTVTPYFVEVVYPVLYVPGSYQEWDPAGAPTLASADFDNKYEGYVNFPDPNTEFKFTQNPDWSVNWGDDGADGTLDTEGANIIAAAAGYYKLNVDINALTYTVLLTDWGLIGDATPGGWDSDQDMTYDADNGVWTITIDLVAGNVKFRANDAWDLDYGSDNANGYLDQGGADIPIDEAGNYTIVMDLSNAPLYTYTITKN